MIGGGFLGGGISIVPAGKALIYASMTTEDGANIPNAVFKATRTGSTVTVNGSIDGRAELLVDAGHTYTVTVTPAGGSYLNRSQTVVTASAKSYAVKFYLYPAKADKTDLPLVATDAEAIAGVNDSKIMTPRKVKLVADGKINVAGTKYITGDWRRDSGSSAYGLDDRNYSDRTVPGTSWQRNFIQSWYSKNVNGDDVSVHSVTGIEVVGTTSYDISSRAYDSEGNETPSVVRVRARNNGDTWMEAPMRTTPGTGDVVNYRRLLDTYDEMVGYVNDQDSLKADKTEVTDGLALKADKTEVATHTGRTDNPHSVTKAQVGLGAYPTSPTDIGISTATQTALDAKASKTEVNSGLALKVDVPTWTYGSGTLTTNAGTCGYNYAYYVIGDVVTMRFTVGASVDAQFIVPLPVGVASAGVQCTGISDDASFWVDYNGTSTSTITVNRSQTTIQERSFHMLVIGQPSN